MNYCNCNFRKAFTSIVFVFISIFSLATNPIVTENALPGTAPSVWDISGAGDLSIQGFATDLSVNKGQTIHFKISVTGAATDYSIIIYRMGYYQGNGAREIINLGSSFPGLSQQAPITDATGLVDCGNWLESASWSVPGTAVSGVYFAKLTRADNNGSSHIFFVVRDDGTPTDLLFKTSDATWQAYNIYGGKSLYVGTGGKASKVSYNRPFITRDGGGGGGVAEDFIFNAEYPMVRWLERNGYDMSYTTDLDMDRDPTAITPSLHKVLLSVGHDEYWSLAERNKFETARNNGVHLAFFSGNEVYWKTRWENSIDGDNTPHRTLVCYKEGTLGENTCGSKCDPLAGVWTGSWRDGCSYAVDACNPENGLSGQISWSDDNAPIEVPYEYKDLRLWRNISSITSLTPGQKATLSDNTIGYEWDPESAEYADKYPNGRITCSNTDVSGKTHKISLYKHSSGAWVFGAGTVQWSWGLDGTHDRGGSTEDPKMQQATVNLLADMNVQPANLQAGLVLATASTDNITPVSIIANPVNGSTIASNSLITITGTATDNNAVGGVEVSLDGGTTWKAANGNSNWSYSFNAPTTAGSVTIKCRAFDDSGNMETIVSGTNVITLNITGRPSPNDGPGGPILVVYKSSNPFSLYTTEMLRAEGLNEFDVKEIADVNASMLSNYNVVILGEMSLSPANVTDFTNWTNNGGTFISFKPDAQLSNLLGVTTALGNLSNQYLLVNTSSAPGSGIVNETIQFHGTADYYTLNTATAIATLFSDVNTATSYPAVTTNTVGVNGGKAFAFTYDLSKSIVLTRQGNPAWASQNRDGEAGPERSDDLFFGNASGDPQPDWVNLDKVAIPQADEQQRLLTNIIIQSSLHKMPLPRFWFLPSGHKAAVVMTGDDHGSGGTIGRFNQYLSLSGSHNNPTDVADWKAIRGSSYIYPSTPMTNIEATAFVAQGFDIGVHLNTGCANFTPTSLEADLSSQLSDMGITFPGLPATITHRTHCIAWSDWATMAKKEVSNGIHLDANYYYWPGTWVLDRPGMFSGSGMPMRFADLDGSLIDCYQLTTQLTDESNINYSAHINSLLDKATGTEGYYGVFCANMHTDVNGGNSTTGSDAIIASALAHNVPVISAKQMLTWLDGRNSSFFSNLVWNGSTLTFSINTNAAARNIQAMLPRHGTGNLRLLSISKNGNPVIPTFKTIKGIEYAFFDATSDNYTAIYEAFICTPPEATITATPTEICNGNGPVTFQLSNTTGTGPYSIVVNGETYNDVTAGLPFYSIVPNENSIWNNNVIGGEPSVTDNAAVEVGVKFRADIDGLITGIRFYKRAANTGTHTGRLWSSTGTLLATVTFTSETATGWQVAKFASPVSVTANTTYVVSYHAPNGQYAFTEYGFQSAPVINGHLTALQSGTDGGNGVYKYGSGGVFPDESYHDGNYWVDAVFLPEITSPQIINYTLTSITDAIGCSNNGSSLSTTSFTVNPLPTGTIATSTNSVCFGTDISLVFNGTPNSGPYQLQINGNTYNNVQSGVPFSTGIIASPTESSIWGNTGTPGNANVKDDQAIEIGVKFRSTIAGSITGIRFYKGASNASTGHVGKLYDANGNLLASVTFTNTNNANTGWVEAHFSTPVTIAANTTYVASYFSPSPGWFAISAGFFTSSGVTNGNLTALQTGTDGPNGVYKYGGGFPDGNGGNSNYWVDVLFAQTSTSLTLTNIADDKGCSKTVSTNVPINITQCSPLPVGLLGLRASENGTTVKLDWSTSFEQNNRGFDVQRSTDGINWVTIGFVAGKGNSNSQTDYKYTDAGLSLNRYYYRLKQYDLDDRFSFSNIVKVELNHNQGNYDLGQNYPNPFDETTTISYYLPKTSNVRVSLIDVSGRVIKVLQDIKNQAAGGYTLTLNRSTIAKGIYYYKMETEEYSETKKMIIQ